MTETDTPSETLLTEHTAATLLMTLDKLDHEIEAHHGWDAEPAIFVVRELVTLMPDLHGAAIEGGIDAETLEGFVGGVSLAQLPVPRSAWDQFAHQPSKLLAAMGDEMASDPKMIDAVLGSAARPDLSADQRTVGFALFCEAWQRRPDGDPRKSIHTHPEERDDEVRIITAMDLDYRQYQVTRLRHAGTRTVQKVTDEEARRMIATSDSPQIGWLRKTHANGQPAIPFGLGRMIDALRGKA